MDFSKNGTPLSSGGMDAFTALTDTERTELWAVLAVETSGCGFLSDKRPKILFERHVFSRLTNHAYDVSYPDISQPTPGGYGAGGANQYNRLFAAMELDEANALQSASWGIGQVMGFNFDAVGFSSVDDMVAAMVESEDNQLKAVGQFLVNRHLAVPLAACNWASFASGYNGADYAANNYDGQLAHFYSVYNGGRMPDLKVRSVQIYLTYKGESPGLIDGMSGKNTIAAIKSFQSKVGLPVTGNIDEALMAALTS